jgi:ribosome-interacting GTPase 1
MPANLTPAYRKAEEAYRQASTVAEKVEALEEMLRQIPKHKGTDHLQADLKRRLAKLREEGERHRGKGGFDLFHIPRQGAGQALVLGLPNSGKSALVTALTQARPQVAPFPFTTHAPLPGMMRFEDVQIQLVDLPPYTTDGMPPGMIGALRNADLLVVCLDISAPDLLDQAEATFAVLADKGLSLPGRPFPENGFTKPMLVLGTKADLPGALANLEALRELLPELPETHPVSAEMAQGLDDFPARCFEALGVVRAYGKLPGREPDLSSPFTLPRGSTVMDFARAVHRGLADELKYARIWGSSRFEGQTVERDHPLADKDIVELHL